MAITINGTGTITGISAGGLPDGSVTAADIESSLDLTGKTVTLPSGTGGKILQVVSTTYEGVGSVSTPPETFTDISGFSVSITPSSTSSKVLLMVQVGRAGANHGGGRQVNFRLMRDSTAIAVPSAAAGSRVLASFSLSSTDAPYNNSGGMTILDSPSTTSATTYKVQMATQVDNQAVRINTAGNDGDSGDAPYARTVSTITAMEVAG